MLMKGGLNNVQYFRTLPTAIVQYFIVQSFQSSLPILSNINILLTTEQFWQENIVQCCYTADSSIFAVYIQSTARYFMYRPLN